MFEFEKFFTQPNYKLNKKTPRLIRALTRAALEKTTRKKANNKISRNESFSLRVKTQYSNLKAPGNNVKMQSDETLTTHSYFFLTTQHMGTFLNETTQ